LQKLQTGERQYARICRDQIVSLAARRGWRDVFVRPSFAEEFIELANCMVVLQDGSTTRGIEYLNFDAVGVRIDAEATKKTSVLSLEKPSTSGIQMTFKWPSRKAS
jgi:hypothetical protein